MNTTLLLAYQKEGKKREGHEEGGGEGDTFLMATRLVMKHTVHKPHPAPVAELWASPDTI